MVSQTLVVTGANTGIGRETALALAGPDKTIWLATRSAEKTEEALGAVRARGASARHLPLDLADFASIRSAAGELAKEGALDVLVNNAGIAGPRGLTKDGFEVTFGTNHLGPFLFTLLLLPLLAARPAARVVNVASRAHRGAKGIDLDGARVSTRSVTSMREYSESKLANILFTRELASRLRASKSATTVYAIHPGVVASDLWRRLPGPVQALAKLFMITNEEGARTSVYCATSPDVAGESGLYYDKCRVAKTSRVAEDDELARVLWRRSLEWTGAPDVGA
jgi:NAD(P)-dependent dehydrogenase (short-subunit alcohol dehydrogenase family)